MSTTTGITASVAQTEVNVHVVEEISSQTLTPILAEPTLIETIIQFITSLF